MDESLMMDPTPEETLTYESAIDEIFNKIGQIDVRIRQNQAEIDRLKMETRTILDELKALA